jgi:outer membrane lipoprotein-sorting protein
MTNERRRRVLGSIGAVAAVAAVVSIGPPGARAATTAFDLAQLMQMLAAVRSGEATFVERRDVTTLDRTLVSSGTLSFAAPDTFVRETTKPRRERMAVTGNTLTLTQGGRTRTLELDAAPEAAVIVEAIRGTLTGHRDVLERLFGISVSGTPEHWVLELVPREARLRGQVASLRISGEQTAVREVAVALADGDRSVMTIGPVASEPAKPSPRPASAAP